MRFASIGLLSREVQHIIFSCQLSVPQQTGSSLIISGGTFCVSVNTKETVWIEARTFVMMHIRRFRSFSSFSKYKEYIRAAALRN